MKVKTFDSEDPKQNHFTFSQFSQIFNKILKLTAGEIWRNDEFQTLFRENKKTLNFVGD